MIQSLIYFRLIDQYTNAVTSIIQWRANIYLYIYNISNIYILYGSHCIFYNDPANTKINYVFQSDCEVLQIVK